MSNATMLTAADIARLANVTRATVSHWRRRHPDFPDPTGGTQASPAYERDRVEAWLRAQGRLPAQSQGEALWSALRPYVNRSTIPNLAALLLCLETDGTPPSEVDEAWTTMRPAVEAAVASRGAAALFTDLYGRMLATIAPRTPPTPPELATLMADIAAPQGTVLDPSCGAGNLLIAARSQGANRLIGEEADPVLAALTSVRMALDPGAAEIRVPPPITDLPDAGPLAGAVLCHPPFKERDIRATRLDPRWEYGRPPRNESELAWLQHCLHRTEPGGIVVLLLPPGVAARPSGRQIRTELLRRGALRAVVALPAGAAAPAHLGLHLWILVRPGNGDNPHRTLFLDGSSCVLDRDVNWSRLTDLVVPAWREFRRTGQVVPSSMRLTVPTSELFDGTVDVTPSLYVADQPLDGATVISIAASLTADIDIKLRSFRRVLNQLSFNASDAGTRRGVVTVADLEGAGDLTILRAEVPQIGDVVLRGVGDRREPTVITETNAEAAGSRYVLRPTAARLDSHFLAGFLSGPANKALLERGPALTGVLVRRLTVPLLPIGSQRALGRAFHTLRDFEASAEEIAGLGRDLRRSFEDGLATGVLEPGGAA